MPSTLSGLMVAALLGLPGLLGEAVYRRWVGVDWREKEWLSVLRVITFGVLGLAVYVLMATALHLPEPRHVFPWAYEQARLESTPLWLLALPLLLHALCSLLVGFVTALAGVVIARWSGTTRSPSAWDEFVRRILPGHWVIVGLRSGESYSGRLIHTDLSVALKPSIPWPSYTIQRKTIASPLLEAMSSSWR